MYKVKSTYKVLANKAMQKDFIEEWIDWALEMMQAGFETENLIILAGVSPNLNRFEFNDIVNRALKELSLDGFVKDEIIQGYIYYLIDQALSLKMSNKLVLSIIRDLCRDKDYSEELLDFYLLAYASEELDDLGIQFYWDDADKNNIDAIVHTKFQDWKNKYESKI